MTDGYYSKIDKAVRKMSGNFWTLTGDGQGVYSQQPCPPPYHHLQQQPYQPPYIPPTSYEPPHQQPQDCVEGNAMHASFERNQSWISSAKSATNLTISRRDLFELIHNKSATREMLTDHVLTTLKLDTAPQHVQTYVRQEVSRFFSRCMTRWKQCKRMKDRFLRGNAFWLNIEMKAADLVANADKQLASRLQGNSMTDHSDLPPPPPPPKLPKILEFPRRERNDGGRNLRALPDIPPEEPPKPRPKMSRRNAPVSYTPEEALDNLIVKAKLTKRQYEVIRNYAMGINCFIYPSFSSIQKVLKDRAARGLPLPQIETEDSDGEGLDHTD